MTDGPGNLAFAASDLQMVQTALEEINISAAKVSRTLTSAFSSAVVSGKSFEQTLQTIGLSLTKIALNAGLQPLSNGIVSLVGSLGAGAMGSVTPFAEGGVVARPTFFGSGGGLGLMGERGAEAILPLARDADGRLGVATARAPAAPVVNVSISTPDADSFRRSQVQVASAIARAVARGQRGL